jgi:cob(I)alamin adenosyltransferase
MVKLDKIYTRGGDHGETSLGDGTRVPKNAPRVAAYGDVDEANAVIGLARLHTAGPADAALARIQNDLFDVGADLCVPIEDAPAHPPLRITQPQIDWLEAMIDHLNAELAPLNSFILPGGSPASAYLHQARTVVRRAERHIVALLTEPDQKINRLVLIYLNRLSDLLFVMSRSLNDNGAADILWVPAAHRDG